MMIAVMMFPVMAITVMVLPLTGRRLHLLRRRRHGSDRRLNGRCCRGNCQLIIHALDATHSVDDVHYLQSHVGTGCIAGQRRHPIGHGHLHVSAPRRRVGIKFGLNVSHQSLVAHL